MLKETIVHASMGLKVDNVGDRSTLIQTITKSLLIQEIQSRCIIFSFLPLNIVLFNCRQCYHGSRWRRTTYDGL
jgi:hypothetical protein